VDRKHVRRRTRAVKRGERARQAAQRLISSDVVI
jgi:hypothetical protein